MTDETAHLLAQALLLLPLGHVVLVDGGEVTPAEKMNPGKPTRIEGHSLKQRDDSMTRPCWPGPTEPACSRKHERHNPHPHLSRRLITWLGPSTSRKPSQKFFRNVSLFM